MDDNSEEPFHRLIRMMEPLNIPDSRPLRDVLPGISPTWGEFRLFMSSINATVGARKGLDGPPRDV